MPGMAREHHPPYQVITVSAICWRRMTRITGLTRMTVFVSLAAACGSGAGSAPAPTTPATPTAATTVAAPADEHGAEPAPVDPDEPPPPEPDDVDEVDAPPPEPVTMTFEPPAPKVELLSRGKGKKTPLRYTAKVGDAADCTMVMDMKVDSLVQVLLPTTTMSWTGTVTLAEKRQLATSVVVDQLDVAHATDPTSERAGAEMRAKLGPMMNATIEAEMTDRGIQRKSSFTSRGPIDPQTALGMQSGAGGGLVVPEEALGVGARWKVTRVDNNGLVATTTVATFEIVARTAAAATIRGTVEAVATPSLGPPATSRGTSDATFTGALCAPSKTTIKTEMTEPVAMTIDMVLETRPRARP